MPIVLSSECDMGRNINPIRKIIERLCEKVCDTEYTLDTEKIQPGIESLTVVGTRNNRKILIENITNMIYRKVKFPGVPPVCKLCKECNKDKRYCFNSTPWYNCILFKCYSVHENWIFDPALLIVHSG